MCVIIKNMKKPWSETNLRLTTTIIISAITMAFGLFIGLRWSDWSPYLGFATSSSSLDFSTLNEIYNTLKLNYDGDIDESKLIDGAKAGLTAALGDQYTVFMDADESSEFQKYLHGDVGAGIGIEFGLRDNYIRILRTLPDNPAREAGVLAGDIIYAVDDEEVYNKSSDYVAQKLRGEAGSTVRLKVYRGGEYLDFTLVREKINNVSAYYEIDGKTAIITLTRFDNDTGKLVEGFLKEFPDDIEKVILDLRGNGGGYVSAARDLLSLWLDGDLIMTQKSRNSADINTYAFRGDAKLKNTKTVVLVDASTASASEIVAGALKDYKKATLVGQTTYGKGVVQTLINLKNSAILKVTTAHWYTPNGNSINETGVTPDLEVSRSFDDVNAMRDPQMDAAKAL